MRIAQTIYSDPEWKKMSRSAIATHTGIRESRLRDWEKRKLLDQRNVADQSGRFTVTTVSGNERTYTKEKLVRTSQKPEPVAAARIAPSNPSLETSIEEIIPDYAPNFPKPEFFQVRPEDIPERGTFQTIGRHHVYVGDAGDRRFQEDLVQSFALAFVSIPYGWTDWNYEWVWDIANVVAVLVEEPLALYTFCRETAMEFQSALFTNFENKPAWVGLYARNELDDLDNGVKGSADLLLRGLTLLHAPRSADQILVINRPTIPFHPIISIEEAGRELWLADQDQMAISREIRNFQIGFATK
jgi:hypothetical protein